MKFLAEDMIQIANDARRDALNEVCLDFCIMCDVRILCSAQR